MLANLFSIFFLSLVFSITAGKCNNSKAPDSLSQWINTSKNLIQKKILPNGLTVLFYPLANTNQVHLNVMYNVGSSSDAQGQSGLAHMVEHMIFKGTSIMSEVDFKLITEKYGNTLGNAWTSLDQTSYYFLTDNKNWPIFLNILADCMNNARFDENHFASEVKAVINELNMNRSNPMRKMWEVILRQSFPMGHPYNNNPIGTREDLINATALDLKKFYKTYYTPDHAALIVVGNIEAQELFNQAEKLFTQPAKTKISRPLFNHNAFITTDFLQKNTTIHTQTTNPQTLLYWLVPGSRDAKQAAYASCAGYILNERLKMLKDSYDLVFQCSVFCHQLFNAGVFIVSFEPKTEEMSKTLPSSSCLEQCKTLIENEIHNLIINGPEESELNKFKIMTRNSFVQGFEDISFVAQILADYCLNKNEYEAFNQITFSLEITKKEIKDFCALYFQPYTTNSISCVPLQEKEKAAWVARQEQIDTYEKKLLKNRHRTTILEKPRLITTLPPAQLIDFSFEKPDYQGTLSNGMTVVIKKRTHTPNVVLHCGLLNAEMLELAQATKAQELAATLTMQLIDEETEDSPKENLSKKDHASFFDSHGASYSFNASGGKFVCLNSDFQIIAKRFFQILGKPIFPEQKFYQKQNNVFQRLKMSKENPSFVAHNLLSETLYEQYPWVYNIQQQLEHLQALTVTDIKKFHATYVTGQNMFISVVGNVDPQALLTMLEKILGANNKTSKSSVKNLNVTIPDIQNPAAKSLSVTLPKEGITLVAGRVSTVADTSESLALLLLQQYLNRELFQIREQTGLFYSCQARLQPSSLLTKDMVVLETHLSNHNLSAAKEAIKKVLQEIADNGIDEVYLANAKKNYRLTLAKSFSTNDDLNEIYSTLISDNKPFDHYEKKLDRVNNLTLETVNAVAKKYLSPENWTFIEVGRIDEHATA